MIDYHYHQVKIHCLPLWGLYSRDLLCIAQATLLWTVEQHRPEIRRIIISQVRVNDYSTLLSHKYNLPGS
jgi:hypothetical protein